ncbi:MAG: hypothetical protein V2A65_02925 [Candidatus Omnitrophota bacterium]
MAQHPAQPNDPMDDILRILNARGSNLESERKETKIIPPDESILSFEEKSSVLTPEGSIKTEGVTKFKEFHDGLIINQDGTVVAVRCQNRKCKHIFSGLNYFSCKRCGLFHCRQHVRQKGTEFFCLHCWKTVTFLPFLQKKYITVHRDEKPVFIMKNPPERIRPWNR